MIGMPIPRHAEQLGPDSREEAACGYRLTAGSETPLDRQQKVDAGLPIARVRDPGL